MKKLIYLFLLFLVGCSFHWVQTPAPKGVISLQTSSIANGVLLPQDFYFTLISQYDSQHQQVRVIILAEPAIKLVDFTLSKEYMQIHEKAPQIPKKLILAWKELVKEHFLTPCPQRSIFYKPTALPNNFELDVKGGVCL